MTDNGLDIVIGDANGADRAMQAYLFELAYQNVTVFCAGSHCRNNVGGWKSNVIVVDPTLTGRDFFAKKDQAMAAIADFGFVLWDGKSAGSIRNVFEMLKNQRKTVLYHSAESRFYNISILDEIMAILNKCDPETFEDINKKARLGRAIEQLRSQQQPALALS